VGDGSTTFNLPDLRGRVPVGKDDMGGTDANRVPGAEAQGATGGAASVSHQHEVPIGTTGANSYHGNQYGTGGNFTAARTWGSSVDGAALASTLTKSESVSALQPYQVLTYIIKH
jgi:microcystin-dependent protein